MAYQLNRCPRYFSIEFMVLVICAIAVTARGNGMNPRSYADRALNIESDMFVGDVLSATTMLGTICKLSGIR
jgi:hypothetical protein